MRMLAFFVVLAVVPASRAHFHMLMPDKRSIKTDETVTLTYQFGHPFEHELFDAEKPEKARVFSPDGKEVDLLGRLEKVELPTDDGKKHAGYRVSFRPTSRGDYAFIFDSPLVWMEDEKHFLHDSVRIVVHVQTQNGWDMLHVGDREFAMVPMTRPYGLRPGTVFQARAFTRVDQSGGHRVEVEHYNPAPPKELPADEFITLALRADRSGVATCALPDPGWWVICATRSYPAMTAAPRKDREGKSHPVVERAILWVFVDDAKAK
jgi:cobalt/nickel transport protein